MGPKGVVGLAGALIVVLLVLSSVYIIPETHRGGVKLRFGGSWLKPISRLACISRCRLLTRSGSLISGC